MQHDSYDRQMGLDMQNRESERLNAYRAQLNAARFRAQFALIE